MAHRRSSAAMHIKAADEPPSFRVTDYHCPYRAGVVISSPYFRIFHSGFNKVMGWFGFSIYSKKSHMFVSKLSVTM